MSALAQANKANTTDLGAETRRDRASSADSIASNPYPMPSLEQAKEAIRKGLDVESSGDRTSSVSTNASNPYPNPSLEKTNKIIKDCLKVEPCSDRMGSVSTTASPPHPTMETSKPDIDSVETKMTGARTAYFSGDTSTAFSMCYDILENPETPFWIKAQAAQIVNDIANDQGHDPTRQAAWSSAEETIISLHGIPPDAWEHDAASLSVRIMLKNHLIRRIKSGGSEVPSIAVTSEGLRASMSTGSGGLDSGVPNLAATLRDPASGDGGEGDKRTEHTGLTSPTQTTLRPPTTRGLKDASNNQLADKTATMHVGQKDQKEPASPDVDPVSAGASYDNLIDRDAGMRLREQDRRGMNLDGAGESHPMGDIPQPSESVRREVEGKGKAREKKYRSWKNKCCNVS